jgi:putative flavoprotein involved in K+ transport
VTQTLDAPETTETPDASAVATAWLDDLEAALSARDVPAAARLFATESYWRDLVSFSWNITTVEGREGVEQLLEQTLAGTDPSGFALDEPADEADGVVTAWFVFETAVGRGRGLLRLIEEDGERRAFTFLTTLYELKGHEEPRNEHRPRGAEHGADKSRQTWLERRQEEAESLGSTTQPYVLVIGGGQGGIALGARLRQLGVPSLVIDKHPRPGDQWRNRYKSLCLHDPVWYDHLPYLKFPDNWPVFAPKDKIGDWLESYTKIMEVPYWSSTTATSASYSEETGEWTVEVEREGRPLTLRPTQLVFATGMSGKPNIPDVPGTDVFEGDLHHSSAHPGPDAYRGKKVVVIGSNNSAFDICGALWENDVDVTMVQRSSTHIVKSDSLMEIGLGDLYSERAVKAGVTTEKADLIFASLPYRILHTFQIPAYEAMAEKDKDFYERLEAAGFDHDWGDDGSGLFMKYLRRGSGYYIDVGAADLVANGDVKLVKGQIDHLTKDAVVLADGTELPADVVVMATGYGSMNGWVADLIDQETADRLGKVWGLGSDTTKDPGPWEGEQRNMWKPTQIDNLWMHGGNLHQSRHYSLYLALQLKARFEGIDTPVYGLQEVHHTR